MDTPAAKFSTDQNQIYFKEKLLIIWKSHTKFYISATFC